MSPIDPSDDLERLYAEWSSGRLVVALCVEADQYREAALAAMRRVLEARGITPEELERLCAHVAEQISKKDERLSRIRGGLVVFIAVVAVSATLQLLRAVNGVRHGPNAVGWGFALVWGATGSYGLYCTWELVRRRPGAPRHTRYWLLASAAIYVVLAIVVLWADGGFRLPSFTPLIWAAFWITYLTESKRVAAVYDPRARARPRARPRSPL